MGEDAVSAGSGIPIPYKYLTLGGMETWLMAQRYPGFMDAAVPMASLPIEMSGRNWMLRRLIIDSIRIPADVVAQAIDAIGLSQQLANRLVGVAAGKLSTTNQGLPIV